MVRRTLSVLLALALVLGWTGAIAAGGCGPKTGEAAVTLSVQQGGCGTCEDDGDKDQPQKGCAVLACTAGCVAGPATAGEARIRLERETASVKATPAPQDALLARAVPPDPPPPR